MNVGNLKQNVWILEINQTLNSLLPEGADLGNQC